LRKAFWDVPGKKIKQKVNRVMVTFGGDDSKSLTPNVLSFLTEKYPSLKKNVIIGNAFKNVGEIKAAADVYTRLIHSPDDIGMKDIMVESDVAISSGGQTLYELACVGVPTVAVAVAENQRKNVKGWEQTGFIENAGFWEDNHLMDNLAIKFHRFMDYLRRSQSAKAGRQLVPGNGANRIVDFIQGKISN
jgi:spore coat polysaccharide biosynthesis predicted glycosyltransferase SpsG